MTRSHPVLEWTSSERQHAYGISVHGDEGQTKRGRNLLLLSWSAVGTTGEPMYFKYPIMVLEPGVKNCCFSLFVHCFGSAILRFTDSFSVHSNKAMKSECFHYDHSGKNITLQQIQKVLVASLNKCAARETHNRLGCTAHYIMGKGDWKWRVEFLNQPRYYGKVGSRASNSGICPRCFANKDNWLDVMNESFDKPEDIVAARASACGPGIPMEGLAGWHVDMELPDILHTIYLGCGRDLVGSLCMRAAETCFDGQTWDERLSKLRSSMQTWCMDNGIRPSTIPELSRDTITGMAFVLSSSKRYYR